MSDAEGRTTAAKPSAWVDPSIALEAEAEKLRAELEARGIWAESDTDTETAAQRTGTLRGNRFGLKPIVWIGIILSVFQQFVGINVIFYYSTELWDAVGFTQANALAISVVTGVVNILVAFAPLKPADDAIVLDSTDLGIDAVVAHVFEAAQKIPSIAKYM